jgi:energy-converting hydrogenase Eha subunit C
VAGLFFSFMDDVLTHVIKFVNQTCCVSGFLGVLCFSPLLKLITMMIIDEGVLELRMVG